MHVKRLLTAAVAIPVLIGAIYLGEWVFAGFVGAFALGCLWEYYRVVFTEEDRSLAKPVIGLGYITGAAIMVAAHWLGFDAIVGLLMAYLIAVAFWAILRFESNAAIFTHAAKLVFGLIYVPVMLGCTVLLRDGVDGMKWAYLLAVLVIVNDSGAYYAGSLLGRHKLIPSVSPGKTIEGAVGGLVITVASGCLFRVLVLPTLPWTAAIGMFIVVGCVGPVGDLFESILKRSGNMKDSGGLLPGHGGLLDRIDAMLFAAPFVYLFNAFMA